MDVVRFADAPYYYPPNHDGVTARRLQGDKASSADFAWIGYSDFRPGLFVPMEAGPIAKVYVVTQGVLTVVQADGLRHRLEQWDSIFIPAGEARAIQNESEALATIIVITPPPPAG